MKLSLLITDANILFSFFKSDSTRRKIIEKLLNNDCMLIAPSFILEELSKEKEKIIKFAKIDESDFRYLFSLLLQNIKTIPKEEYTDFIDLAKKLSPHEKDVSYFALALSNNCSIWSDELEFKKQSQIKIFSTKDLLELLL